MPKEELKKKKLYHISRIEMMTMTSRTENTLPTFRDGTKFQQCLRFGGSHDYESIDSKYISENVIETEYICLSCGDVNYFYNYLEDSEL
jgi:hypothetical protein